MKRSFRVGYGALGLILICACASNPSLSNRSPAESKSLGDRYVQQAREFSNPTLVKEANSADWSWMWMKPEHVLGELDRRSLEGTDQSVSISRLMLLNFRKRGVNGSYAGQLFLNILERGLRAGVLSGPTMAIATDLGADAFRPDQNAWPLISEAREIYYRRFLMPLLAWTTERGAFADQAAAYGFLKSAAQVSELRWLSREPEFATQKSLLLNTLYTKAGPADFEGLLAYYEAREPGLKVYEALRYLHRLNNERTVASAKKRFDEFDEINGDILSIADEIKFLRDLNSKPLLASLMPKLLRLLDRAEKEKHPTAAPLILSSMGGGGGSGSSGGGSGGGGTLSWTDIVSSTAGSGTPCESRGSLAKKLYERGIVKTPQIILALQDLASNECRPSDQSQRVRGVFGAIADICAVAAGKNDDAVMDSCARDVFKPLAQSLKGRDEDAGTFERLRYLHQIYASVNDRLLKDGTVACRMKVSRRGHLGRHAILKRLNKNYTYFIAEQQGRLVVKDCRTTPATDRVFSANSDLRFFGYVPTFGADTDRPGAPRWFPLVETFTFAPPKTCAWKLARHDDLESLLNGLNLGPFEASAHSGGNESGEYVDGAHLTQATEVPAIKPSVKARANGNGSFPFQLIRQRGGVDYEIFYEVDAVLPDFYEPDPKKQNSCPFSPTAA